MKVLGALLAYMLFGAVIGLPVHEFGHLVPAYALGDEDARIVMDGAFEYYCFCSAYDDMLDRMIALAGGMAAGIVLIGLATIVRRDWDVPIVGAAIMQFVYAPFDPDYYPLAYWASLLGGALFVLWQVRVRRKEEESP